MSAPLEQQQRQVIPRWRSFGDATRLGELNPSGHPPSPAQSHTSHHLFEALERWQEAVKYQDHRLAVLWAGEVIGGALARGEPSRALDAASHVLEREHGAPPLVTSLARRVVQLTEHQSARLELPVAPVGDMEYARVRIREVRKRLRENPHNPIAWVELARAYATMGATRKAIRAMTVALGHGSENRFVLRSAARLFVHTQDLNRAHEVLSGVGQEKGDPWLLASELAVAHISGLAPLSTKAARRLANDEAFASFERSELLSAIATLELSSGNDKRARKFFDASLIDPHENSLAQVTWAAEKAPRVHFPHDLLATPESYEARARDAAARGDWNESLQQSLYWLHAEPFSADAAIHASYVATVGNAHHQVALDVTSQALAANPGSAILRNNRAYSLVHLGRLEEASAELLVMQALVDKPRHRVPLLATSGLIAYRSGGVELGRSLYRQAIDIANSLTNRQDVVALAWLHFAHEEVRAGGEERDAVVQQARAVAAKWRRPDVLALLARMDAMVPPPAN